MMFFCIIQLGHQKACILFVIFTNISCKHHGSTRAWACRLRLPVRNSGNANVSFFDIDKDK